MMSQRVLPQTSQELHAHLRLTQAKAVILLGTERVLAVAGSLSPAGFQVAAEAMRRYWPSDSWRWAGLLLDDQFVLLAARPLPDDAGLIGLIFPERLPLSQMRRDLTAFNLALLQEDAGLSPSSHFMEQNLQKSDRSSQSIRVGVSSSEPTVERNRAVDQEEVRPLAKKPSGHSSEKRASKPSHNDWEHISSESIEAGIIQGATWQPLAEVVHHEEDLVSILQEDFESTDKATPGRDWRTLSDGPSFPTTTAVQSQVETQPVRINPALENWAVGVEIPIATAVTFYLAPRQTKHFLIGGLSRELRKWMPELCETYGWELDLLSVRPDYLKWTLRDFPEALTRDMLQTVRGKTSHLIFKVFPNLREGADSPDFWAPGYLVDNQNRDFTTRALMAHVAQERLGENF